MRLIILQQIETSFSKRHAGQYSVGASAKIFAPQLSQSLMPPSIVWPA